MVRIGSRLRVSTPRFLPLRFQELLSWEPRPLQEELPEMHESCSQGLFHEPTGQALSLQGLGVGYATSQAILPVHPQTVLVSGWHWGPR